jgi:hypothetical protein
LKSSIVLAELAGSVARIAVYSGVPFARRELVAADPFAFLVQVHDFGAVADSGVRADRLAALAQILARLLLRFEIQSPT